jgi:hypothetical protein
VSAATPSGPLDLTGVAGRLSRAEWALTVLRALALGGGRNDEERLKTFSTLPPLIEEALTEIKALGEGIRRAELEPGTSRSPRRIEVPHG